MKRLSIFDIRSDHGKHSDPGMQADFSVTETLSRYESSSKSLRTGTQTKGEASTGTSPEQGLMLCCTILGVIVGIVIGMVWAYAQVHENPSIWIDRLEKQMEAGR